MAVGLGLQFLGRVYLLNRLRCCLGGGRFCLGRFWIDRHSHQFGGYVLIFLDFLDFCILNDGFCFHRLCLYFCLVSDYRTFNAREHGEVQMLRQFIHQPLTQVMGNALHSPGMLVLQRGLAVLVGASERSGCQHILGMSFEIGIVDDMLTLRRIGQVDKLLVLAQSLLMLILLNNNQVAASLRISILLEEIVGQTEGSHQVGFLKEHVQSGHVLTVEIVAGRDECHHATVTHGIESLLHKVAMQRL